MSNHDFDQPCSKLNPTGLWNHIESHYDASDTKVYAHFSAIVQFSGMGKSRTVDELSKGRFVISLNLRGARSTGG